VVRDAITTLINQCLRDRGLTFQQNLPSTQKQPPDSARVDVVGVLLADTDGYGLADYLALQQQSLDDQEVTEPLIPPGEGELIAVALWGDDSAPRVQIEEENGTINSFPTTGCQAEAQEEVYGVTVEVYERTRLGLPSITEVIEAVSSDPSLAILEGEWGRCMTDHGFGRIHTLDDLLETTYETYVNYAEESDGVARLASWETEIAEADSGCRAETTFGNAVVDSFLSHGHEILSGHEELFTLAQEIETNATENAERIMSNN
jgi:hypothetical protein